MGIVQDPKWLARVVNELQEYRVAISRVKRELCYEYYAPAGDCSNGLLSKSRELGRIHELLRDAEAILRDLESRYIKQLKAAVLREMAEERVRELVKAASPNPH